MSKPLRFLPQVVKPKIKCGRLQSDGVSYTTKFWLPLLASSHGIACMGEFFLPIPTSYHRLHEYIFCVLM